jgi:DNA-binding transcriptional ArsR family regulator
MCANLRGEIRGINVLRLHLAAQDLAKVRMRAALGPVAESIFALDLFARNNNLALTAWRKQVRRRLGQRVSAVERLVASCSPLPDLLPMLEHPNEDSPLRRRTAATLLEFCQAAVLPSWSRARNRLEVERVGRGRIVITKGVEHLLATLHPTVRWQPPVLEVPDRETTDVYLDGRGLLLCPSAFLVDRPCVILDLEDGSTPPTLIFSLPLTPAAVAILCGAPERGDQALSALVGHTRAAALQALADSCTTGELAQRLNISSAGASQHATVLREAGLIVTCRNRNTVLHSLTPLGIALLQTGANQPAAVPWPMPG